MDIRRYVNREMKVSPIMIIHHAHQTTLYYVALAIHSTLKPCNACKINATKHIALSEILCTETYF